MCSQREGGVVVIIIVLDRVGGVVGADVLLFWVRSVVVLVVLL